MLPNLKKGIDTPRPDMKEYSGLTLYLSSDEYCPHCDNHFVLEAVTPKPTLQIEGDDARMDSRYVESRGDSILVAIADISVGCSRMTEFGVTKNDLCSICAMCPTGWARGWSLVALIFMKLTTFLRFTASIYIQSYYPPSGTIDQTCIGIKYPSILLRYGKSFYSQISISDG